MAYIVSWLDRPVDGQHSPVWRSFEGPPVLTSRWKCLSTHSVDRFAPFHSSRVLRDSLWSGSSSGHFIDDPIAFDGLVEPLVNDSA